MLDSTTFMVRVRIRTRFNFFLKFDFRVRCRLRVVDRPRLMSVLLTILGIPEINVKIRCLFSFMTWVSIDFVCNISVRVR